MRFLVFLSILIIPQFAHAGGFHQNQNLNDDDDSEVIEHRATLPAQLGMTNQEVVFGKPRTFRCSELNELPPIEGYDNSTARVPAADTK